MAIGDIDAGLAQEAAAQLGAGVSAHHLDVTDPDSFAEFVTAAERTHDRPVDVLVNNAGIMPNGAFLEGTERIDRRMMDVNVHGVITGMRLVLPAMVERGRGHVVNVASLAGKFPLKGLAVYNASKFAAVGLTAAVRLEMADTGVSVTAVLPSAVRTELSSGIDLGVLPAVDPEDIAAAIVGSVKTRAAEIAVLLRRLRDENRPLHPRACLPDRPQAVPRRRGHQRRRRRRPAALPRPDRPPGRVGAPDRPGRTEHHRGSISRATR